MRVALAVLLSLLLAPPVLAETAAQKKAAPAAPKAAPAAPQSPKQAGEAKQAAPKKAKAAKPKASPTAKADPAVIAVYMAMPVAERRAIQSDLVWTGDFNGIPSD